jgi:hypothetical protein
MAATARMDRDASGDDVAGALGRDGYAIVEQLITPGEAAAKRDSRGARGLV